MSPSKDSQYEALEKIFHEPNRLAIMSAVCAAERGISFSDLRNECGLTDGNLNRHLKVLKEAGAIDIAKSFVDDKPRTMVKISRLGLRRFGEYLEALSDVLDTAKRALPETKKAGSVPGAARAVEA